MSTTLLYHKEIDFDSYPLGNTVRKDGTVFRVFAPKAAAVEVVIFEHFEDDNGVYFKMEKDDEGIWNRFLPNDYTGKWYAYELFPPDDPETLFLDTEELIADPWSRHVTSVNHYLQYPKTKILPEQDFDWEGDSFRAPEDLRDLVIYESHIKDLVAHPSAKTYVQGIYNDFREAEVGGISHLKKLGVNAVEFLPLQKFAYFEPPFNEETPDGIKNTWNPYSRNYWGYMTSFFFAPETIYASGATLEPGAVTGRSGNANTEFKSLVKALHKEDISVLMDVVYNHASHYDLNPLKYTDKEHYFRLDEKGNFKNDSWTGNDIKSDAKYARKLIVESVKYWMQEYHIDGFRFDLAGIIDMDSIDLIKREAEKINPNVILIAEPWGGEYKPDKFSDHGWAAWNDRIRNSFKGYNPREDKGFIFGNQDPHLSRYAIENFIRGTLKSADHGLFNTSAHSVNYLESHDGYTLGDYIRIALDPEKAGQRFDKAEITPLNKTELRISKFAALSLFISQGIAMIHAGQEWGRSKVIADHNQVDPDKGKLDRDSYNKDNETNWLNFNEIDINKELFEYYRGLIKLRLNSPALRKADPDDVNFKVYQDPLHVTFSINGKKSADTYDYFISLNANTDQSHEIVLPEGKWQVVVNEKQAGIKPLSTIQKTQVVPPSSGLVLRKLRVNKA